MYSMPNDMHGGKLPSHVVETFPFHVYLKSDGVAESGGVSVRIYFADEKIVEWLAQNITGQFDYRKNVGARDELAPFQNPPMEPVYCFENETDAIAFKLRWVGAPE